MPTFPTSLPAPLIDGYALQPQDTTIRTGMDGGLANHRRRFTAPPVHTVPVKWLCTSAGFGTLTTWLNTYGRDWFDIALTGPAGSETVQARMVGPYQAAPSGTTAQWQVSASLEVRAFSTLGAEYIDALAAYDDLIPAYNILHPWVAGQLSGSYYP